MAESANLLGLIRDHGVAIPAPLALRTAVVCLLSAALATGAAGALLLWRAHRLAEAAP